MKTSKTAFIALLGAIMGQCVQQAAFCREIDLTSKWNDKIALENPHKGWYQHYFDNHINRYLAAKDSDLLEFPGMDHLYLRLSWAYLEPQEGQFNWQVIDKVIDKNQLQRNQHGPHRTAVRHTQMGGRGRGEGGILVQGQEDRAGRPLGARVR